MQTLSGRTALGRLRLRGPRGAQDEFTLAATAQNLRRLAKLMPDLHRRQPRALRKRRAAKPTIIRKPASPSASTTRSR